MPSRLVTVQDCIDFGEQQFTEAGLHFGHGTDNAADEALWLVFHQLQLPWDSDQTVLQTAVGHEDYQAIQQLFQQRIQQRVPAAYLTREAWFAGIPFSVNEQVLVPRSPIAELIQQGYQPWLNHPAPQILDLCTGSGCIGIASAMYLQSARVVLSDISPGAIAVANANIHRHQLTDRVVTVTSDVFGGLPGQQFDLIVSNPPYVDAQDYAAMPAEYHAEPVLGLTSGTDGLDLTRRILREAAVHLTGRGILIVEVGNSWQHLEAAFPQIAFTWIEFEFGGHGVFVMTKQELEEYRAAWG